MHLELNNQNTLEIFTPKDNKQVVYKKINQIMHELFNSFASKIHFTRQKIFGFTIQYKDMYGIENTNTQTDSILHPNKYANDMIYKAFNEHCVDVYKHILIIYEKIKDMPLKEQKEKIADYLDIAFADNVNMLKAVMFINELKLDGTLDKIEKYKKQYEQRVDNAE